MQRSLASMMMRLHREIGRADHAGHYNRERFAFRDYLPHPQGRSPLRAGHPMPALALFDLEGRPFDVAALWAKHDVVLEFGSLSCPSFRSHIMAMEALRARHNERVRSLIVYTREAHPGRGLPALTSMEDKILRARQLARRFPGREVVVDAFDGELHRAFGAWPNSVVIVRDGDIVARAEWNDPDAVGVLLDDLMVRPPGAPWSPVDVDHNVPAMREPALWLATLSEAGLDACVDYIAQLPLLAVAHLSLGLGLPERDETRPWPSL